MTTAINTRIRSMPALLLAALLLGGCASVMPVQRGDNPDFTAVKPPEPIPAEYNNGAIYQSSYEIRLFEDYKARRVGDILTVRLAERTQARKSANTSTSKDSSASIGTPTILGHEVPEFETSVGGSRSFEGQGDSAQSNQLDGQITVMVADVLPNGNLVVQGEKWIRLNQGEEYIRLRGIVRPVDVRADNTVLSTQIANAQVAYGGSGTLADSNSPGWLTRFFNSPIFPF
ncbi:flagellar basal body L-ring protein [Thioalkalivibrio denitrificans]|uniref:Flagellar L-ring protein n=1 Tax=Thioalkalivibrio denitrificans TaxID=108003 RepID=A0A1V3NQH0_9GAMM|nr:flagellar basal body L-ring protein FlgH [Thioalkalivibrio denitrificans]OOG27128.1 flagellar basal body L-ring protein [Thioalkalivibrio denitrificans]